MNTKNTYIKKQVKDLLPGDIILHPIFRADGLMLMNRNVALLPNTIKIIKKHLPNNTKILVVCNTTDFNNFVNNKVSETDDFINDIRKIANAFNKYNTVNNIDITSYLPEKELSINNNQWNSNINLLFSEIFSKMPLWNNMEDILESEYLQIRAKNIKNIFMNMLTTEDTFRIWLEEIKNTDDTLMIHSINITCIALLFGLVLELNDEELLDLSIASLFSNAGFIDIPKELTGKIYTSKHSTTIIKKHLETFTNITSNSPYLRKKSIIYGILDSHEFYNGTGFPNKKKGQEISLYGRILHICHHYDIVLNGYFSTNVLSPQQAMNSICENKEGRFDSNIIKLFIHRSKYLKLGEKYTIPNNKGIIIGFTNYMHAPHLPIVKFNNGEIIDFYTQKKELLGLKVITRLTPYQTLQEMYTYTVVEIFYPFWDRISLLNIGICITYIYTT